MSSWYSIVSNFVNELLSPTFNASTDAELGWNNEFTKWKADSV